MADAAGRFRQNALNVEDAYSCIEDPEPQNWTKIADQEVDQPPPRIEIHLNFESGVQPAGKILPPSAQALIGRLVYKKCAGIGYLGTVVDYDANRGWFRIDYDDEGSEDLKEREVRKLLATQTQIEQHLQELRDAVNNLEKVQEERRSTSKPKRKRMGSKSAGKEVDQGTYVPLSTRNSCKKDDYFYF